MKRKEKIKMVMSCDVIVPLSRGKVASPLVENSSAEVEKGVSRRIMHLADQPQILHKVQEKRSRHGREEKR